MFPSFIKLGIHQYSIPFHLSQQPGCIPFIPDETFRQVFHGCLKVYFDAPCLGKFEVQNLIPPILLLPHTGDFSVYFQHNLASSRCPNLGSGFVLTMSVSVYGIKYNEGAKRYH
ncbi:hypothetical protein AVEN_269813-1 [Araneus ventricosus]|uniref:Uncharacterized protein n=1 Tax=Araneus ventricosus TaxID=182803 RepID=A0A4Y2V8N3_ARAVE|nr:hypothetical protein AVEN_269813-1 [Araneus ventricosus]